MVNYKIIIVYLIQFNSWFYGLRLLYDIFHTIKTKVLRK